MNQIYIGWDQVFCGGRISKNWNLAIMAFNKAKDMGETTAMSNWSVQVISGLWQVGIERWINRKEAIYGKTEEEQLARMANEVDNQIEGHI